MESVREWAAELKEMHRPIAHRFARPEPRESGRSPTSKGSPAPLSARTAGSWPRLRVKLALMGCSDC